MTRSWIWIGLLLCVPALGQERKAPVPAQQGPGAKTGCLPLCDMTAKQIQFTWVKQALIRQGQHGEFPAHAKKLQDEMRKIVQIARAKYPALRIAYLSSRIYGGYAKSQLNPEPYAYEGAFSMRWLI